MKAYDVQAKAEVEVTVEDLMKLLDSNRQVDLVFSEPRTDEDGYLTWDRENWLLVKEGKYQRNYFLNGKALYDFTHHNKYDMKNSFFPDQAEKIERNQGYSKREKRLAGRLNERKRPARQFFAS